jgi:glycosyltransferase involved in cell wall biosynthesis
VRIVHAIASLARTGGGTSTFVSELATAQSRIPGNEVCIATRPAGGEDMPLAAAVDRVPLNERTVARWMRERHAAAAIDVANVHALWLPFTHRFLRAATGLGIPTILSTHGMLEPNALRLKWWKKRIALIAYQRRDLRLADALHATALPEAETLRRFGLRQPIIVAPPGLTLPAVELMRSWSFVGPRQILYFSRIHPKKNVLGLVEAWAAVRPQGWTLRIVGPDEGGHAASVNARITALGLTATVSVSGPVYGSEKQRLFADSSLFILPSFTENFGIVVAEALAHGVPAIATHGTPWRELVEAGCGWWVAPDHESLVSALVEATRRSDDELATMGLRGRRLAEARYQWPSICDAIQAAYLWLLGRGPKPDCVLG